MGIVPVEENARQFRIWWIPQVPMNAMRFMVSTIEEAAAMLRLLATYDEFQFHNNVKGDYCNTGGLEVLTVDGWECWYPLSDDYCDIDDPLEYLAALYEEAWQMVAQKHGSGARWGWLQVAPQDTHYLTLSNQIVYEPGKGWGQQVAFPIDGSTWEDVFLTCSKCISESGDEHHRFVENIVFENDTYMLKTGS